MKTLVALSFLIISLGVNAQQASVSIDIPKQNEEISEGAQYLLTGVGFVFASLGLNRVVNSDPGSDHFMGYSALALGTGLMIGGVAVDLSIGKPERRIKPVDP